MEELRDALATMDNKLPAEEVANLLQDVDMNESGAIDYEEFLAATLHASKIAADEHMKRAFQEFDADNSGAIFLSHPTGCRRELGQQQECVAGTITQDELKQALEKCGGYEERDVQEILRNVDKDQDGCIDYEEFVEMMVCKNICVVGMNLRDTQNNAPVTSIRNAGAFI